MIAKPPERMRSASRRSVSVRREQVVMTMGRRPFRLTLALVLLSLVGMFGFGFWAGRMSADLGHHRESGKAEADGGVDAVVRENDLGGQLVDPAYASGSVSVLDAGQVSGSVSAPDAGQVSGSVSAPDAGHVSSAVSAPDAGYVSGAQASDAASVHDAVDESEADRDIDDESDENEEDDDGAFDRDGGLGEAGVPRVVIRRVPPSGRFGLQFGAFEQLDEARAFVLSQSWPRGLRVYIQPTSVDDRGVWFRVRGGAFREMKAAERKRANLPEDLRERTIVVRYR